MRRSTTVSLVLLGAVAGLTGCDDNSAVDVKQDYYTSKEECHKDWGPDDQNCTPATTAQGGGTVVPVGSGGYYGPHHYWDRDLGKPVAVAPDGSTRVLNSVARGPGKSAVAKSGTVSVMNKSSFSGSRGGFGSSARGVSSGG